MKKILAIGVGSLLFLQAETAFSQRLGGDFGGGGQFWVLYIDPGIDVDRSFGRDVGGVTAIGGRGFLQTRRVRLGGGGFGGSFSDEGLNEDGNRVQGGLSAAGFTAEYLAVQQDLEVAVGALLGGGVLSLEERLSVSGDVEELRRRRDAIFVAYPWVRLGYNPAPFVNVGLQLGYFVGTEDVGGFAIGLEVGVGLIP